MTTSNLCNPAKLLRDLIVSSEFHRQQLYQRSLVTMMAAPPQTRVHYEGIYHGLSEVAEAASGLTAIVTGANGVSGSHMVYESTEVVLQILCFAD